MQRQRPPKDHENPVHLNHPCLGSLGVTFETNDRVLTALEIKLNEQVPTDPLIEILKLMK